MNEKQLSEYVVLPDITLSEKTVYWVVEVKTRNEDGSIAAFEKVEEHDNDAEAQQRAEKLNGRS